MDLSQWYWSSQSLQLQLSIKELMLMNLHLKALLQLLTITFLDHRPRLIAFEAIAIWFATCFFLRALPQAARAASQAQCAACLVAAHSAQAHCSLCCRWASLARASAKLWHFSCSPNLVFSKTQCADFSSWHASWTAWTISLCCKVYEYKELCYRMV